MRLHADVLIAEKEPRLYERAAVRFAGRYLLERRPPLDDAELVVAALRALAGGRGEVARSLLDVLMER